MEYYVLYHEFNKDIIKPFNIFDSYKFNDGIQRLLKNFTTFDKFKEELDNLAKWCFWSKSEYEIICKGWVSKEDREYKIDIYDQIKPNLDILAKYIIDCYNNRKYARKKIDINEEERNKEN